MFIAIISAHYNEYVQEENEIKEKTENGERGTTEDKSSQAGFFTIIVRIIREHRKLQKRRQGGLSMERVNSVVAHRNPSRCKICSTWFKRFHFIEVN